MSTKLSAKLSVKLSTRNILPRRRTTSNGAIQLVRNANLASSVINLSLITISANGLEVIWERVADAWSRPNLLSIP